MDGQENGLSDVQGKCRSVFAVPVILETHIVIALMFKTKGNFAWQFVLAVMRDRGRHTTRCLCLALRNEEMEELISSLLPSTESLIRNPLLVPVSLLVLSCRDLSTKVSIIGIDLWRVQKETGLHGGGINHGLENLDNTNLRRIILTLINSSDVCTRVASRVKTLQRVLKPIEETLSEQERRDTPAYRIVQSEVEIIRQTLSCSQQYIDWFQASVQSQVQTVREITVR